MLGRGASVEGGLQAGAPLRWARLAHGKHRFEQLFVTQLDQAPQLAPEQHMVWHWAGGVLESTHCWKQPISEAQVKSLRQLTVSLQQALTMHWLHGVPPGSRGHIGVSMGMPQWPPLHTLGEQHCVELLQLEP